MHPILDALDNTPHDWIKKLLFTFNEGNIGKFEAFAPLFPKEVRFLTPFIIYHELTKKVVDVADPARELRLSPTKNLFDGLDRVGVQERFWKSDIIFPNDRGGDKTTFGRGRASHNEGSEVVCSSASWVSY
jgi:hypothetical protein